MSRIEDILNAAAREASTGKRQKIPTVSSNANRNVTNASRGLTAAPKPAPTPAPTRSATSVRDVMSGRHTAREMKKRGL